jgi:hypothetical protein
MRTKTHDCYDDELQPWNVFEVAEILRDLCKEDCPNAYAVVRFGNSATPMIRLSLPVPVESFVSFAIAFGLGKAGWDSNAHSVRDGRQRFCIRPRHLLSDPSVYETHSA